MKPLFKRIKMCETRTFNLVSCTTLMFAVLIEGLIYIMCNAEQNAFYNGFVGYVIMSKANLPIV